MILELISQVAYLLALSPHLLVVHPVFGVSLLQIYVLDQWHVNVYEEIELQPDLSYEESVGTFWIIPRRFFRTKW